MGADKITPGADVFSFGMVVIEVGPRPSPRLSSGHSPPDIFILP